MTQRRFARGVLALFAVAALAASVGCGARSKHDILQKAEGVETKSELLDALGEPSERGKLGPVETWTYAAKDGNVTFVVLGNKVSMKTTSDADESKGERP